MNTLKIGFSRNNTPFSWLIRKLTGSNISHTYIRIPVPELGTSMVFQAQGFNVHYINYEHFLAKGNIVEAEVEVKLSSKQWAQAEMVRVYECGKPYSYLQILGYAWVLLGRRFGKKWKNPLSDGDHGYVCVELVCRSLGISEAESMTPQELLDRLTKVYGKV